MSLVILESVVKIRQILARPAHEREIMQATMRLHLGAVLTSLFT
jgi:hypothetical protein